MERDTGVWGYKDCHWAEVQAQSITYPASRSVISQLAIHPHLITAVTHRGRQGKQWECISGCTQKSVSSLFWCKLKMDCFQIATPPGRYHRDQWKEIISTELQAWPNHPLCVEKGVVQVRQWRDSGVGVGDCTGLSWDQQEDGEKRGIWGNTHRSEHNRSGRHCTVIPAQECSSHKDAQQLVGWLCWEGLAFLSDSAHNPAVAATVTGMETVPKHTTWASSCHTNSDTLLLNTRTQTTNRNYL